MCFVLNAAAACPATVFDSRGRKLHYLQPPAPLEKIGFRPSQRSLEFASLRLWIYASVRQHLLCCCCPLPILACRLVCPFGRQARDLNSFLCPINCCNNAIAEPWRPKARTNFDCPHHASLLQQDRASAEAAIWSLPRHEISLRTPVKQRKWQVKKIDCACVWLRRYFGREPMAPA